jgi:restriction system protein
VLRFRRQHWIAEKVAVSQRDTGGHGGIQRGCPADALSSRCGSCGLSEMTSWQDYQEETAAFFRGLGLQAETDVTLQGVRTSHDIDVVVRSHYAGFDALWLVECKQWQTRITKLHVLALREIVSDVGADRGILMAEAGFQHGAIEAANLTNVKLTSLADLGRTASAEICMMRIRDLQDRLDDCQERYWGIDKDIRIAHRLRPDVGQIGYSGARVCTELGQLLADAARGKFPISNEDSLASVDPTVRIRAVTPEDLIEAVEPIIAELEVRLTATESATQ